MNRCGDAPREGCLLARRLLELDGGLENLRGRVGGVWGLRLGVWLLVHGLYGGLVDDLLLRGVRRV